MGSQIVDETPDPAPSSLRERHRRQRRREFLDVALGLVTDQGLGALTMQQITDNIGCATGSIYYYFGTKGALIAELQLEALSVLASSLQHGQAAVEHHICDAKLDPATAALLRVVAAGRFWIEAEAHFPQEIELCRRLFTEPGEILADDEAEPVVPPTMALFDLARGLLDDAATHHALQPGWSSGRSVLLLAGTTGVMLTSALGRWDRDLFNGRHLATAMLDDLLTAWGAAPDVLAQVSAVVDQLDATGELVPLPDVDAKGRIRTSPTNGRGQFT